MEITTNNGQTTNLEITVPVNQNEIVKCDICHKEYSSMGVLRRHIRKIHDMDPYRVAPPITNTAQSFPNCNICKKDFSSRKTYRRHMQKWHRIKTESLVCCNMYFVTQEKYQKHVSIHDLNIQCTFCDRAFALASSLRRHIMTNHNEASTYGCDHCNREFTNKNNLKTHLVGRVCIKPRRQVKQSDGIDAGGGGQRMNCPFCDESLKTKVGMTYHLARCRLNLKQCKTCEMVLFDMKQYTEHLAIHPDNELFLCNICGETMLHTWEYTAHLANHNPVDAKCEVCEKFFKSKNHLRQHMRVHFGQRNFQCNLCVKKFYKIYHLKLHKFIAHSGIKPFMCDECGAAFSRSADLKRHCEDVHLNGPRLFNCDICGKSFKRMATLRIHQRIHEESKPYKCDMCDKSYTQPYSLKEHKILHTNPLKCDRCGQSFTRMKRLNEHQRLFNCKPSKRRSKNLVEIVAKQLDVVIHILYCFLIERKLTVFCF